MKLSSNEVIRLNVRYYRILNKITQKKMAEYLNVDEKHYCSLESGRYNFTLQNIDIISEVFDIEPWILFKEMHNKEEIELLNKK